MQNQNSSVLIIGAGLGGLALAQGLVNAGIKAKVFDRDESPLSRPQGYRITIRSMGMNALTHLLSTEKMERLSLAKVTNVGDGFTCADEKMNPLFMVPTGQEAAVQMLRSELRNILQEGIDIQWNKRLIKFEEIGDTVVAYFEDGTQASGDILVGCDGGLSTVRGLLPFVYKTNLGSTPLVIDGTYASMGGQIDRTEEWETLLPLNNMGIVRYVGPNCHSLGVCFSERIDRSPTIYWALSEKIDDRNSPWYQFDHSLECRRQLLEHCKNVVTSEPWHENLKKLINDTPPEEMFAPWLIRTTQFPNSNDYPMVPSGRVTLLGDAAHAMPPDRGLGGNNVLEDARLLCHLLASSPKPIHLPKLIEKYETEMFARSKVAVEDSNNAATYFQNIRSDASSN